MKPKPGPLQKAQDIIEAINQGNMSIQLFKCQGLKEHVKHHAKVAERCPQQTEYLKVSDDLFGNLVMGLVVTGIPLYEVVLGPWTIWIKPHEGHTADAIVFDALPKHAKLTTGNVHTFMTWVASRNQHGSDRSKSKCQHIGPITHVMVQTSAKTKCGKLSISIQSIPNDLSEPICVNWNIMTSKGIELIDHGLDGSLTELKIGFSVDKVPPHVKFTTKGKRKRAIRHEFIASSLRPPIRMSWLRLDMIHEPDDTQLKEQTK